MTITINGKKESIDKTSVSISELLTIKEVKMPDMVTVEYNGDILDKKDFDTTTVSEGDEIEFLYFMGGGQ